MKRDHTIHTTFNVFWMATFDDYDGAPDASPQRRLMGAGETELVAIADLLDKERDALAATSTQNAHG